MNKKYRKAIIAGNWKMNLLPSEVKAFADRLKPLAGKVRWCEVAICPPALMLPQAVRAFRDSRIAVGAQNMCEYAAGAYTGEISAPQLRDLGVKYVILGHSERRALFGETDQAIHQKLLLALDSGLTPILCVGETLEEREAGITQERIAIQLKLALRDLPAEKLRRVVIAYEPVWAIGTGRTATPEQAQAVCGHIRTLLRGLYGARPARSISILYGGSMNGKNAAALLAQPDVDGGLIGGASLQADSFFDIVLAARDREEDI